MLLALMIAAAPFGARGQVVPFGSLSFSHINPGNGAPSWNNYSLEPGVFVFAMDHLALGLAARYDYRGREITFTGFSAIAGSAKEIGILPKAGIALNLSESLSLFPQLGVDLYHYSPTTLSGSEGTYAELETFVPLLFSPVSHFFVGIGPYFEWTFTGAVSGQNEFGLQSIIGGWF
jgi:hypothetical protein